MIEKIFVVSLGGVVAGLSIVAIGGVGFGVGFNAGQVVQIGLTVGVFFILVCLICMVGWVIRDTFSE